MEVAQVVFFQHSFALGDQPFRSCGIRLAFVQHSVRLGDQSFRRCGTRLACFQHSFRNGDQPFEIVLLCWQSFSIRSELVTSHLEVVAFGWHVFSIRSEMVAWRPAIWKLWRSVGICSAFVRNCCQTVGSCGTRLVFIQHLFRIGDQPFGTHSDFASEPIWNSELVGNSFGTRSEDAQTVWNEVYTSATTST